jgi:rSAM/selenodomain-associated transferase 1
MHRRGREQLWGQHCMKEVAIIIFQKKPELGKVKTRLAKTIGEAKALETYQLLLQHTHEQVALVEADVFVYFEKEVDMGFIRNARYAAALQTNGDLGHKMKAALQEVLAKDYQKAIVIGSDCPDMNSEILQQAINQLTSHDLVLGPAKDGGYYLIGMRKMYDTLFENTPWSTSEVFSKTLAEAKRLGLKVSLLRELADVDVYEDLDENLKNRLGIA